ncbi:MAG: hypothetical protein ACRCZE_01880 [Candidatus Altimarinota bacterium]
MAKKKLNPKLDKFLKIFIVMVLVVVSFKVMVANQWEENEVEGDNKTLTTTREDFVMCLKESGLIMYGDNTCEFCRQQKKMFGSQFEELNYVNCQFEKEICESKGISAYPVWEINEKRAIGIQNFEQLGQLTNCPQPNN